MNLLQKIAVSLLSLSFMGSSIAGTMYTVRETDNVLVSIDTSTLAFTSIGSLGISYDFGGLAYDPFSDTLYLIDGRGAQSVYTVNRTTGAASLIGSHGITDLFGLAYDTTNNKLYGSGESPQGLYEMNVSTGSASLIGTPTANLDGLAYDSKRDQLVGYFAGAGDLYSINRNTGSASLLFNGDFVNNNGLTYDPDLDRYWSIDWSGDLYGLDPNNSYARTTYSSGLGAYDGLAYLTSPTSGSVPDTGSTALLLGAGLLGLAAVRRKMGRS